MTDPALQSYIDTWLGARPARHQALPFVREAQRDRVLAWGALEHALFAAAYGISEVHVATAKLDWWGEELVGAVVSGGRHPVVKVLFADPSVRNIDPALWLAAIAAAQARLCQATPPDFATQLERSQTLHGALATLETRILFGADADPTRASRFASLDYLLQAISVVEENAAIDRLPLPMDRMARHHLDRDALTRDGPERRAAVGAQLHDILEQWRHAWTLPGPLGLFRGLDARLGQRWLRRALRGGSPLARLRDAQRGQTGLATLCMAWSAARDARAGQVD